MKAALEVVGMQKALNAPTVSVIIPSYNSAAFLGEAIESVLSQRYSDLELIVIDDGSTDETLDVLRSFKDPRLLAHRQDNTGLAGARNAGMERARGEYIAFLDADDRWLPEKLQSDVDILQTTPRVGIVVSNFVRFIHETDERLSDQFAFYPELKDFESVPLFEGAFRVVGNAFDSMVDMGEIPAYHSALTYRRSVLDGCRFLPVVRDEKGTIVVLEDVDFFLMVCQRTEIAFQARPMMEMRRHESNSTRDYESLTFAKLGSLRRLRDSVPWGRGRRKLTRRIAREWANVGYWRSGAGSWRLAAAAFASAAISGRPLSAMKGALHLTAALAARRR